MKHLKNKSIPIKKLANLTSVLEAQARATAESLFVIISGEFEHDAPKFKTATEALFAKTETELRDAFKNGTHPQEAIDLVVPPLIKIARTAFERHWRLLQSASAPGGRA